MAYWQADVPHRRLLDAKIGLKGYVGIFFLWFVSLCRLRCYQIWPVCVVSVTWFVEYVLELQAASRGVMACCIRLLGVGSVICLLFLWFCA